MNRRPRTLTTASFLVSFAFAIGLNIAQAATGDAPFFAHSDEPHQIQVINDGTTALQSRLSMIENAATFLDLEYFIFDTDSSGRLVLQALQKRAADQSRPIEIRVLVDYHYAKSEGITPAVARVMEASGIKVRYFNPTSMVNILKYNHRDHRKLIISDDSAGNLSFCTGGRNIADDYFDLNGGSNFMDRDVCVQGPITQTVAESFNRYWASRITRDPMDLYQPNVKDHDADAADIFVVNAGDLALRQKVDSATPPTTPRVQVNSIDFATDIPDRPNGSERVVQSHVESFVQNTQQAIRIDNYTYLPKKTLSKKIRELLDSGKDVSILTNDPKANPDDRVTKIQFKSEINAVRAGADVYLISGQAMKNQMDLTDDHHAVRSLWAEHAKSSVRDHQDYELGTYNFDLRSANINSEDIVIIYGNKTITDAVEQDMDTRIEVAHELHDKDSLLGPGFQDFAQKVSLSFFSLFKSQY